MLNTEETKREIIEILASNLDRDADSITIDSDINKDLEADSLDVMEIIMVIEEKYSIEVSDEDAQKIKTVGDLVNFITSKSAQ